jgi:hypothetical protein
MSEKVCDWMLLSASAMYDSTLKTFMSTLIFAMLTLSWFAFFCCISVISSR